MQSESYVVVGVMVALWFVREAIPLLSKAIRGGATADTGATPAERIRSVGLVSAGGLSLSGGYSGANGADPGDTGRHTALGATGEHDHLVTQREFQTFQESIKEDNRSTNLKIDRVDASVGHLQTAMTQELRLLTRAVGQLEGAQQK